MVTSPASCQLQPSAPQHSSDHCHISSRLELSSTTLSPIAIGLIAILAESHSKLDPDLSAAWSVIEQMQHAGSTPGGQAAQLRTPERPKPIQWDHPMASTTRDLSPPLKTPRDISAELNLAAARGLVIEPTDVGLPRTGSWLPRESEALLGWLSSKANWTKLGSVWHASKCWRQLATRGGLFQGTRTPQEIKNAWEDMTKRFQELENAFNDPGIGWMNRPATEEGWDAISGVMVYCPYFRWIAELRRRDALYLEKMRKEWVDTEENLRKGGILFSDSEDEQIIKPQRENGLASDTRKPVKSKMASGNNEEMEIDHRDGGDEESSDEESPSRDEPPPRRSGPSALYCHLEDIAFGDPACWKKYHTARHHNFALELLKEKNRHAEVFVRQKHRESKDKRKHLRSRRRRSRKSRSAATDEE